MITPEDRSRGRWRPGGAAQSALPVGERKNRPIDNLPGGL